MPLSGNLRSILAMCAAVGFFSLMDTVLKLLSAHYPALQVAALRGLTAMPLVVLYVAWRREGHTLLKIRWPLHLLRGVIGVTMLSLFTFALRELPLVDRRGLLEKLLAKKKSDKVRFSAEFGDKPDELVIAACKIGLEGVIGKRRDARYVSRRSPDSDATATCARLRLIKPTASWRSSKSLCSNVKPAVRLLCRERSSG